MIVEDLQSLRFACKSIRLGYTSGVFDLFHLGHASYLEECKKLCDVLVVGVDCDAMVRRNKKEGRPIESVDERLSNVSEKVDYCFLKKKSSLFYVEILRPSYHFFSSRKIMRPDQISTLAAVDGYAGFYLIPYIDGVSTTDIIRLRPDGVYN
jgi:cytidyltransferase-like protein